MEGGVAILLLLIAGAIIGVLALGIYFGGWFGGLTDRSKKTREPRPAHTRVEDEADQRFVGIEDED